MPHFLQSICVLDFYFVLRFGTSNIGTSMYGLLLVLPTLNFHVHGTLITGKKGKKKGEIKWVWNWLWLLVDCECIWCAIPCWELLIYLFSSISVGLNYCSLSDVSLSTRSYSYPATHSLFKSFKITDPIAPHSFSSTQMEIGSAKFK